MELTIEKALQQGIVAHKSGQLEKAEQLYRFILEFTPKHSDANHNLAVLLAASKDIDNALMHFKIALETQPSRGQYWVSYIETLIRADRIKDAAYMLQQGQKIGLKGSVVDQLRNRLQLLQKKNRDYLGDNERDQAKSSPPGDAEEIKIVNKMYKDRRFNEAYLKIKQLILTSPSVATFYNICGSILVSIGNFDLAIESFSYALKFNSQSPEVLNNIGMCFKNKGQSDLALQYYEKAIEVEKNFMISKFNLIEDLSFFSPRHSSGNSILKSDREIKKISLAFDCGKVIPDERVNTFCLQFSNILETNNLNFDYPVTQTQRKNSQDLNCQRHKKVFNTHKIIPRFCFGCFKVEAYPETIVDLLKLYLIFNKLNLPQNNTRKCFVELRPAVAGFYKGTIYCSSIDEALMVQKRLNDAVQINIHPLLETKLKRGCSEYAMEFPTYSSVNLRGPQNMEYNDEWSMVEQAYDSRYPKIPTQKKNINLTGTCLKDALIIRNWYSYALGIGDQSASSILVEKFFSEPIFRQAKERVKNHSYV